MSRRMILAMVALALTGACGDRKEELDPELARDLQLATAQPAVPQLADGPLDAPEAKAQAPEPRRQPQPTRAASRPVTRAPRQAAAAPRPQQPAPRPVVEEPVPEPAPEASPSRARGVLAGTSFGLSTGAQVCTSNRPGDKIVATVTSAVIGEDGAVIPVGSTVVLEVANVTPGSSPGSAQLGLRVRSVVIDGQAHPVAGDVAIASPLERGEAQPNGSDKKKVIGGAIAGAVIGQVLGRDTRSTVIGAAAGAAAGTGAAMATRKYHACLPAGSSVRVTTNQPILL